MVRTFTSIESEDKSRLGSCNLIDYEYEIDNGVCSSNHDDDSDQTQFQNRKGQRMNCNKEMSLSGATATTAANTTLIAGSVEEHPVMRTTDSMSSSSSTDDSDDDHDEDSACGDHCDFSPASSSTTASYAATALALTVQDWSAIGTEVDNDETGCTGDLDILVDRVTSLLLVRIAAVASAASDGKQDPYGTEDLTNDSNERCHVSADHLNSKPLFTDYSTSTICRTVLMQQQPWHVLTPTITPPVVAQLRQYVYRILERYNDAPYHNREHAFHVVLSTNKLLDMMLQQPQYQQHNMNTIGGKMVILPPTYGLRQDPIKLMALVFAALVHDVEHLGLPNRQLALESDPLAIQYNDFSIAEQRSLYIAFHELLKDDYIELRTTMFGIANVGVDAEQYRRFRATVVNLVLNTDIASPERTQLVKSKWKEAFGEKVKRNNDAASATAVRKTETGSVTLKDPANQQLTCALEKTEEHGQHQLAQEPGPSTENLRRSSSYSSEDEYTIPITPDASESNLVDDDDDDDDEDDGIIFHTSTNTIGATNVRTVHVSPTKRIVHQTNNAIHQSQLDKLDYLIRLVNVKTSGRASSNPDDDDVDAEEALERQKLYGRQNTDPPILEGPRIEKSSSLPGKLEPPVPIIECSYYYHPRSDVSLFPQQRPRRMSAPHSLNSFRMRLGIRRSMDLSGEALETYSSNRHQIYNGRSSYPFSDNENAYMFDQPDELKASVLLETILVAADVAHNLQGWEQMVKWSGRLYMELRKAYANGRASIDPRIRWYENQIGFLESYLMPLAERLVDFGVFGNCTTSGGVAAIDFIDIVKGNRDQWLLEGFAITKAIISAGDDRFPAKAVTTVPTEVPPRKSCTVNQNGARSRKRKGMVNANDCVEKSMGETRDGEKKDANVQKVNEPDNMNKVKFSLEEEHLRKIKMDLATPCHDSDGNDDEIYSVLIGFMNRDLSKYRSTYPPYHRKAIEQQSQQGDRSHDQRYSTSKASSFSVPVWSVVSCAVFVLLFVVFTSDASFTNLIRAITEFRETFWTAVGGSRFV